MAVTPLETPIGAVIAGDVNNAAPAKLARNNDKVRLLSLLPMTTLLTKAHDGSNRTTSWEPPPGNPTAVMWTAT